MTRSPPPPPPVHPLWISVHLRALGRLSTNIERNLEEYLRGVGENWLCQEKVLWWKIQQESITKNQDYPMSNHHEEYGNYAYKLIMKIASIKGEQHSILPPTES